MAKRELIDMFKNKIFPKQAEDLLKMNYEGLGELDKREYLRDTSILIMLAEKGLKTEKEIVKPYLEKLKAEIGKSKTEHEMQIAERDIKAKLLISHIYCDIVNILDKCKTESEEENDREPEKAN